MPAHDFDASELERREHIDQLGHVLVESEPHGTALVVADHEVDAPRRARLRGRLHVDSVDEPDLCLLKRPDIPGVTDATYACVLLHEARIQGSMGIGVISRALA